MKIFLCRHGQTTGDIDGKFGGDYDDHLTELGKKQSQELAEELVSLGVQAIFASPKIRAQETAWALKNRLGVEIILLPELRERNRYGVITGMTRAEAAQKYPQYLEMLKDYQQTIEGGEDYTSFGDRVRWALLEVINSEWERAAVVTHGGPIRYIFREMMGLGEIQIGDCSMAELDVIDGQLILANMHGMSLEVRP